jgi:O-acetylserine/cysteine efflux transporter
MPIRDILLSILVPIIFGFGFVIAKPAMDQLPPILLNGLRWTLTGLIMCWFFPFPKKLFKLLLVISIIGSTLQYSLTFSGLNIVDATSATLLIQSEIPFGILIAFIILKEKPSLKNLLGLVIAFTGIVFLTGSPNLENKLFGVFLLLSGAFLWAFAQVMAKPVSEKIGGLALTAWIGVFAGPSSIFLSYFIEGNTYQYIISADLKTWIIVIYLGLIMNCLAYSIWYYVLSKHPVNYVMPVMLLFPVTGLITAIFLLGETPSTYAYVGGFIIISGVAIILINKREKIR